MTIYKAIGFVNKRVARGRNAGRLDRVFSTEAIIIDNLETAKRQFESIKNQVATYYYDGYSGKAQLFIPHLFDDGTLAYWPDDDPQNINHTIMDMNGNKVGQAEYVV